MRSCIFSIITPVFSVTWSSEIIIIYWFTAQETILIIINVKNSYAASYFCGNVDTFYLVGFSSKEQYLFEIEILTVTFDQFNASLMNTCYASVLMSQK